MAPISVTVYMSQVACVSFWMWFFFHSHLFLAQTPKWKRKEAVKATCLQAKDPEWQKTSWTPAAYVYITSNAPDPTPLFMRAFFSEPCATEMETNCIRHHVHWFWPIICSRCSVAASPRASVYSFGSVSVKWMASGVIFLDLFSPFGTAYIPIRLQSNFNVGISNMKFSMRIFPLETKMHFLFDWMRCAPIPSICDIYAHTMGPTCAGCCYTDTSMALALPN